MESTNPEDLEGRRRDPAAYLREIKDCVGFWGLTTWKIEDEIVQPVSDKGWDFADMVAVQWMSGTPTITPLMIFLHRYMKGISDE
jgi:hypothetical protein